MKSIDRLEKKRYTHQHLYAFFAKFGCILCHLAVESQTSHLGKSINSLLSFYHLYIPHLILFHFRV